MASLLNNVLLARSRLGERARGCPFPVSTNTFFYAPCKTVIGRGSVWGLPFRRGASLGKSQDWETSRFGEGIYNDPYRDVAKIAKVLGVGVPELTEEIPGEKG